MNDWANLIRAIGSLLWPVLIAAVLLAYRAEIRAILSRIRKGKMPGLEIELSTVASEISSRPLASSNAIEQFNDLLSSPAFRSALAEATKSRSGVASDVVVDNVIAVVKDRAAVAIQRAFVRIDSRPLLGRDGQVWEEPLEESQTVSSFLNRLWFAMRAYVVPMRYRDGWVLRDQSTGRLFTEIGTKWAREQGELDDKRLVRDIGIEPGSMIEVVPGPRAAEALDVSKGVAW